MNIYNSFIACKQFADEKATLLSPKTHKMKTSNYLNVQKMDMLVLDIKDVRAKSNSPTPKNEDLLS